ncbi:hypothetical protein NDU88_000586 [Pleurodeles waltl]|uniref:Uncharacterized protein n=1 Tax=Pleurodeles waltl TaxID=8319 RepID=A0AAV7THM0_PLEWA|nr:hypothetical protein NDU88_000586 [Pleurodeles waltl]
MPRYALVYRNTLISAPGGFRCFRLTAVVALTLHFFLQYLSLIFLAAAAEARSSWRRRSNMAFHMAFTVFLPTSSQRPQRPCNATATEAAPPLPLPISVSFAFYAHPEHTQLYFNLVLLFMMCYICVR